MKLAKFFTTLSVTATFALSSVWLPKPKEALAQAAPKPYAVLVNGYQDCCVWSTPNQSIYMDAVARELRAQGTEIRLVPWDSFKHGAAQQSSSNDKRFLDEAAEYINNQLDPRRPLILIGHSFGGDSLLSLAPRINRRILFLGVIDPVPAGGFRRFLNHQIPLNVDYFFNRWQTNVLDAAAYLDATKIFNTIFRGQRTYPPQNIVPFDSRETSGLLPNCQAKECGDQQEQNLARRANGEEIRVACTSVEVGCEGWNPIPVWLGGSNGTKAQRLFHNVMPYDEYIQQQIVDKIKPLLANYQAPITEEERIKQLYRQILGREADPDGLRLHINILRSGQQTFEQIRAGMSSGQESRNNINNLYRQYLNRDADPGGMEHHVNLLASGQMTLNQIREGIRNGQEAQQLRNR